MWFLQIVRSFFFMLDSAIFNFIPTIYDLLMLISRTSILSQGQIKEFADRIQVLLGVFMLFKVSFSLITYVINPDEFSDKSKGFGKLWQNVIIALIMLVLSPYAFNMAYDFQAMILEDNTLATLIFGENPDKNYIVSAGDQMAYTIMIPFFSPDISQSDLTSCVNLTVTTTDSENNVVTQFNPDCRKGLYKVHNEGKETSGDNQTYLENYIHGIENSSLGLTFRLDIAKKIVKPNGTDEVFLIDYTAPISTVVAVVTLLLLISFCLDVALRSVKLAFLQLIAPVPIISFIDPKSGKDGIFKKWYQMCFSTYLSLFIRLTALYFGIYIISKVNGMHDIINGSTVSNGRVQIFIVIGVLMFVKQLPKILEGLGIKLGGDGKFTLNPFKKFGEEAIGGKRILGAAGALTAGSIDRAVRLATAPGFKNKLAAFNPLSPIGNIARGFSGNGGFLGGMKSQANVNRRLRESRVNGLSPTAAYFDYFGAKFGLDNATLERESYYVQKSKDNAARAKRELEQATLENSVKVDNARKSGAVRKNTQASHENVGKQIGRFIDSVDDFVGKKGNFNLTAREQNDLSNLRSNVSRARTHGLSQVPVGVDSAGNIIMQDIDEYEMREARKIGRRSYKSFRDSDATNVKFLSDHNGEELETSMLIGDQFFKKGDIINTDMINRANDAKNKYLKDSQSAAVNDVNTLLLMSSLKDRIDRGESLTADEQNFYNNNVDFYNESSDENSGILGKNIVDFASFRNIKSEITEAVEKANNSIDIYNKEYNDEHNPDKDLQKIAYNSDDYSTSADFYNTIKSVKGSMETGDNVTQMNNEARALEALIEKLEAEIESLRRSKTTEYYDKKGHSSNISLDEYDKRIKLREEELNDLKKRHKELANIHESGKGV